MSSEKAPEVRVLESEASGSDETVSSAPFGKVLQHGVLRPVSSSPSSTGEISTRHHSPEKGMLWRGFLLRQSFGVALERRCLCLPEMRLLSFGPVKTPRGKVIDAVAVIASGPPPVAFVAAVGSDAAPPDVPVVRGNNFISLQY